MNLLRQTRTIAYYTLLEALRNRLIWLLLAIVVLGIGLTGFLKELAITESNQIQVALLAALLRFSAVFLLTTFIVTCMVREFNDKGIDLLLALPLPRTYYLLGKLIGFAVLAILFALVLGALTAFFAPMRQVTLWTISLLCELWLTAAFSLLCVLTFQQTMGALSATLAFYLLARSITMLQLIGHSPLAEPTLSQRLINFILDGIAAVLPHLDEFARTDWLTYASGTWSTLAPVLVQTTIYMALLMGAALFDLYRKNI